MMLQDPDPSALPKIPEEDTGHPAVFVLESHLNAELLHEFRSEALQQIELAEIGVLSLAGRPQDAELVAVVFRAFHTIKGMACFAGIPCIIELAHDIETYLDPFRRGGKIIERHDTDVVLEATDVLRSLTDQVREAVSSGWLAAPSNYEAVRCSLRTPSSLGTTPPANSPLRPLLRTPVHLANRATAVYLLSIFQRVERLAEELARHEQKEIIVTLDCAEIKVDAHTAQLLSEALLHLLRNALTHGIELPAVRVNCGKPLAGRLKLSAQRCEHGLTISFKDDGRGLNAQAIQERAAALRLLPADAGLDDNALLQMIFHPAYTTSDAPTELHGRGIGLDIVRKSMEALGGSVEVRSVNGTEFLLSLPL